MSVAHVLALALLIVVGWLAAARLTRLVVTDTISAPLRVWVIRRWGPQSKPAALIRCPWCFGFWVNVVVAALGAAAWWSGHPWYFGLPAAALAGSYVTGYLAEREADDDGEG